MGVKIDLKPGTDRKILGHVDQDGIQLETGEHVAITTIEVNDIDAHHAPVVKPDTTIIYEDRIGETNYNKLDNLPSINSIILTGNKTLEELGIQAAGDYAIKDEIIKDASNINYKDNYGYGGENVQNALDIAFATLDDTPNYSDLDNYVSYNTQSKTATQQNQARKNIGIPNSCVLYNQNQNLAEANKFLARKNIGAKKAIKYLGEIDLSQYNDDVFEFISTLTSEGEYKFVDSYDGFTWLVNVVWLGDYLVGQSYCYSEEGYEYIYYRSGYYDENTDTYTWNNWTSFLTSSQGLELFALKNHVHYNNVTTAYTIRTYLDRFTGNGDYRITSNVDKELYIFSGYYHNVSVNGVAQYRRSQRYYSISEPWKVYSRFGLYNPSTKKVTWNAWHVVEGVEE